MSARNVAEPVGHDRSVTAKPNPPGSGLSDLRGATRLASDAAAGLADLVEAMHERITRLPGVAPIGAPGRTRGITGLVYRSIRGATQVAGGSADALLALLTPVLALRLAKDSAGAVDGRLPRPQREAIVAALNGVLGDHLAASANPLAIPMSLRREGRSLVLQPEALQAAFADTFAAARGGTAVTARGDAGAHLLVALHGLCMNDLQMSRNGRSHAQALAQELGMTALHLHYNSGLPVADNGLDLSRLLQQLLAAWPQPVRRLTLLGHSMGGLLARSALAQAHGQGHDWPERLTDLVFLGTPHHGAPLERAGHGLSVLLAATPYVAPFGRLARLRSAGITDLRHGHLLRPTSGSGDSHPPIPLPAGVACFAIAGHLGSTATGLKARLLGDGLVPVDSALGRHTDPARTLAFDADRTWVAEGVGHIELLHQPEVTQQLLRWLRPARQRQSRR